MTLNSKRRRVLFHRKFNKLDGGTGGGQMKVRDCFEHVRTAQGFEPKVYFSPDTIWFDNPGNVWQNYRDSEDRINDWKIESDDLLIFAGRDWEILNESERRNPSNPIINIVHPRHTRVEDDRNKFLQYPAIRITKSTLSKKILEDFGVNGPVYIIPDAIDSSLLPLRNENPNIDILIVGLKNPRMAKKLLGKLKWRNFFKGRKLKIVAQLPPKLPTRADFLNLVNRAKIVVYLPLEDKFGSEGFYLPALEGMFLGKFVICPFAVGNVDFCIDRKTCLMPEYKLENILESVEEALGMSQTERDEIIAGAKEITKNHEIDEERKSIIELLNKADVIWNQEISPRRGSEIKKG